MFVSVIDPAELFQIPVGKEVLGRVMNLFGKPLDGKGEIKTKDTKSIYSNEVGFDRVTTSKEIIQTGIKAIDFFSPVLKGGKIGIFVGQGRDMLIFVFYFKLAGAFYIFALYIFYAFYVDCRDLRFIAMELKAQLF